MKGLNWGFIGLIVCPDPPWLVILTSVGTPVVSAKVFVRDIVLSSILTT